jgi:pantetheine-phosphate adenylyltransferase
MTYPNFHEASSRVSVAINGVLFPKCVIEAYNQPHRHWHNLDHMQQVFTDIAMDVRMFGDKNKAAILAAIYHDAVYVPSSKTNEEDSIAFMRDTLAKFPLSVSDDVVDLASIYILQTKNVYDRTGGINYYDQKILRSNSVVELIEYGKKIWKEYNHVQWKTFVKEHILLIDPLLQHRPSATEYSKWLYTHRPSLALYAGSFNPFHIGHKAIADEASRSFDKVLLAKGINLDKVGNAEAEHLCSDCTKCGYQYVEFGGMLSNFYSELSQTYDVTVIKGIRNGTDLEYEKTQERFLRSLNPNMKFMYIFSKAEHEHISSSAIRNLEKYGQDVTTYLA